MSSNNTQQQQQQEQAPATPDPDPARLSIDLEMSLAFANETRTPEELFNSFYGGGGENSNSTPSRQQQAPQRSSDAAMPPITQPFDDDEAVEENTKSAELDEPEVTLERAEGDMATQPPNKQADIANDDRAGVEEAVVLEEKKDVVDPTVAGAAVETMSPPLIPHQNPPATATTTTTTEQPAQISQDTTTIEEAKPSAITTAATVTAEPSECKENSSAPEKCELKAGATTTSMSHRVNEVVDMETAVSKEAQDDLEEGVLIEVNAEDATIEDLVDGDKNDKDKEDQDQSNNAGELLTQAAVEDAEEEEEEENVVIGASQQEDNNDVEMEDVAEAAASPPPPVVTLEKNTKSSACETEDDRSLERLTKLEETLQEQKEVEATLRKTIDALEANVLRQNEILVETEKRHSVKVSELMKENETLKAVLAEAKHDNEKRNDSDHDIQAVEERSIETVTTSMRVSLDPVPEPEESPSKSSDTSDEDSTASDAGPPLSKLITNKNLRTFSRIINRFDPSKHHFKRDVFNGIWERLKTQDVEGHQMWGYQRPKSGLNLDFTFHFATPDGQELFATELDLVLRVVEEIQQCCEEGRLRVGAVDTILSMKQNGRRQRKTRVDLNPIKKEKKKNKEKQAKRKIVIEQEVQAPETANTKKEKQAKEKVEIEEEDEVSEAGSEISEVDTEVLSEGQLLTKVSKSTIAKIINSASPDDFNFMRDIFCPVWDVLTRQGGRGKESVSRWSWLRNNNKVPSMLDAPDYVYAVPFSKGCKKGSIGVDFFFKEIEVLWKVISLIQEDSESADGQPLSLSSDIVEKIQTKREENMNGLQKRKRQLSARAEQSIAAANAEKKAKEAKKAREKAKKMSKPTVKDGKKEKESAKLVTKKNDSSNKKKPKTSWTPKKISKKTKKVAVVEEDDASASIADDDKSTFTSFSEYSSSSSEDTEVIADGQLLTQVSMERCSRYCNKMLGSSNTALTELQVIRMLFNPIWTILKSQGTGKPSKWQYVPQSYNKLLSPHIWAVPGNDTNYLKEKPLQDSGYFETQMEVLACVCEYLRHQGMLSEKAWQCILAASSQKNNSRSSRSRRASVSRGDEQPQQKENSSAKKSRKRKSSLESSSSKIKKKKAETTPTGKVPSAPKHKSVEKKKVVKAKSKPKATEEKKKVRTAHVVVREEPTYFGDADSESISTKSSNGAGILRRNHVSPSSMSGKTDTTSSGESSSLTSVSTNGRPSNFDSTKEQPFQRTKAVTASTRRGVLTGVTFLLVGVDDVGFGNNIRQIVLDLGGIIAESITAVQMPVFHEGKNSVFFVSHPSQRRTLKYIFAAALQIPMLHYNWVLEMRKRVQQGSSPDPFDEKLFESMRLPYGLSLSSRRFKLPPLFSLEKVKSSDRNYLEGLTLMVVLGNQHMEEDWGNILRAVGVTIVPISILGAEPTSPKLQKVDAILTDSILLPPLERTVPVQLKHALAACGGQLPVVDLLWAIQCIVNRKKLNWEDNKIDLHDVTKRQIYSVKRSDNTRFDIGDIVQLIENGRRANSFGRILSFETRRSPSAYQHGFGYTVHLEEIEDRGQNLVDGGRVRRELNVEVTSLVSHVVMMKGKDFRQIQSSYGEDVYVQKVMARKSTD